MGETLYRNLKLYTIVLEGCVYTVQQVLLIFKPVHGTPYLFPHFSLNVFVPRTSDHSIETRNQTSKWLYCVQASWQSHPLFCDQTEQAIRRRKSKYNYNSICTTSNTHLIRYSDLPYCCIGFQRRDNTL